MKALTGYLFYTQCKKYVLKYELVWGDSMTKVLKAENTDEIVKEILAGQVVAFPTETVYGIGCQYGNQEALEKLFIAKNRDHSKAITLMVEKVSDISRFAYVDDAIMNVAQTFMPGRITLILKKRPEVDDAMTNGLPTIGIRIPDSQFVLNLIHRTGPLLVTSANLSGQANTTNEKEVLAQLDGRIASVVAGQTSSDVASTVVQLTDHQVKILRAGAITEQEIKEAFLK